MIRKFRELVRAHVSWRLRGNYTRALENEIGRLRAENRGLVNSILGLAGIPPMRVAVAETLGCADSFCRPARSDLRAAKETASTQSKSTARFFGPESGPQNDRRPASEGQPEARYRATLARRSLAVSKAGRSLANRHCSLRRRSWQQIGRAREIEDAVAARRESDMDAFPAPRNIIPRRVPQRNASRLKA